MLENAKNTELGLFKKNSSELTAALTVAIESACGDLEFDVRCLDWFSYTPDFFIAQKDVKAA